MTRFVALLRGITPSNPDMRNEKLRGVCEALGLRNVQTVISSGNVIFDTDATDVAELQDTLEAAWEDQLGFNRLTILRTREEVQELVDSRPFGDLEHKRETYLLVTFAKSPFVVDFQFPYQPDDGDYSIIGVDGRELFSVVDTTSARTPDLMGWLDKRFDKQVSSRTWLTVERILKRMAR